MKVFREFRVRRQQDGWWYVHRWTLGEWALVRVCHTQSEAVDWAHRYAVATILYGGRP